MAAEHTRSRAPATVAFSGATLDRAAHLRGEADRLRTSDGARVIVVGPDQDVALARDGTLAHDATLARDGTLAHEGTLAGNRRLARLRAGELPADAPLTFLGLEPSGAAVFAIDAASESGHAFTPLRELMDELDPAEGALAAYAVGMVGWHRVHRHCGRCGHATEIEQAGHRRRCPICGLQQFPRTDPAVTMLVQTGSKALLSRRRGAPPNRWSALAGFVEPGETPEEAVVREAREETGEEVTSVEYVISQPWPFPSAVMIGFWAYVASDAPPTPDANELVEVRWWDRGELSEALRADRVAIPPAGTIGNFLISTWLAGAA